ncbi:hypothetical protein WAE61_18185 [Comamonadaceae bacterium PP-2]
MSQTETTGRVPSVRQLLDSKVAKRKDALQVRHQDIHVEPDFNLRELDDDFYAGVRELARYLDAGGTYPPLEVRPRPEGGVWIVDGHRRHAALAICIERGSPFDWIDVRMFNGNDAERIARVITSAEHLSLKPLEIAKGYKRLKAIGLSINEIAALVHKTRTSIENGLRLAGANVDVQTMVKEGKVSATVATRMVRKHGEAAGRALAREVKVAQESGKARVMPKQVAGPSDTQLLNWLLDEQIILEWEDGKVCLSADEEPMLDPSIDFATPREALCHAFSKSQEAA